MVNENAECLEPFARGLRVGNREFVYVFGGKCDAIETGANGRRRETEDEKRTDLFWSSIHLENGIERSVSRSEAERTSMNNWETSSVECLLEQKNGLWRRKELSRKTGKNNEN